MNSIRFYVDIFDQILKCDYYENIDKPVYHQFNLAQQELYNLWKHFTTYFQGDHERLFKRDYTVYKYYDVDLELIYKLISISELRGGITEFPKSESKEEKKEVTITEEKKKVKRVNLFDNQKVSTAISTLIIIGSLLTMGYIISRAPGKKYTNIKPITTISENIKRNINDAKDNIVIIDERETTEPIVISEPEEVINITSEETPTLEEYDYLLPLSCDDWTKTEKYNYCKENYEDLINKYAQIYGLDPKLVLAIACHERGVHSSTTDSGGGLGLFQIQVEGSFNWDDVDLTTYNFTKNDYETHHITKEALAGLEENIKVGCMIIQDCLVRNNYNILKSVQEYNYGCNNLAYCINECCRVTGYNKDYFASPDHMEWLNYRYLIKNGDPNYIENVFKYINNNEILKFTKPNGEVVTYKYQNLNITPEVIQTSTESRSK